MLLHMKETESEAMILEPFEFMIAIVNLKQTAVDDTKAKVNEMELE